MQTVRKGKQEQGRVFSYVPWSSEPQTCTPAPSLGERKNRHRATTSRGVPSFSATDGGAPSPSGLAITHKSACRFSIPKGLCPPAQGCEQRATLGKGSSESIQPQRGCGFKR